VEAAGRAGERGCWAGWLLRAAAGREVGLRGLMGWIGKRVGVLGIGFRYFRKRIQSNDLKLEFEFQQPKEMLQHECNS
jgi:hypothetical protein